ncbi:cyclic nucleotide-binding domain-containing protein [Rhizorhapis suberifaciens]|uniref:CRP-like cAMP-binding protein/Fe-S-cluster-containing hydrogenase component 2/thioredoxin reductase n=1 Tax=Rhizorhapis suberifaciens TaxID=13656 RepID=A0A840HT11_9SPHN|nr:cyclic nucleotide-binding domain-containing protein [Rhizorhapis suberifaciens]MBB4640698.1 CRP-like cAMP-binding protein/Fe-S-cluster-containing hydrogenase component 2/thioredoxin reductase [Rhizorhapis suberifaciens]
MGQRYRIAIIGSGPAGLSAAGRAAQLGLSHVLLEKTDHLSDTIYKYQKGKHVMATPSQLVLRSDLDFDAGKREAVLGTWNDQAAAQNINVAYNAEVKAIAGTKGAFAITLTSGQTIETETVVLAIGTQGNPNLMRCPGGDLPHVQYQLDDPSEYVDEHITVIGSGDAGIENALGLAADPAQGNVVTILNRGVDFARAKAANVKLLMEARDDGRVIVRTETSPTEVRPGELVLETRDGQESIRCDRVIARMGSAAPRVFVESCGIEFTSADREAFPKLSPVFETTTPGIFVIGALAGYPLIKHCMNQGYDVVEFINGNHSLNPADQPILEAKFDRLPQQRTVDEWLEHLRANISILNELSPLQMREFMLDSEVQTYRKGEVIFQRLDVGSSLFGIADGSVLVEVNKDDANITVPIERGSIFGEVGLISGRRRGATIRAVEDCLVVEVSRTAALKLMASVPAAKRAVTRISTERQLLQMFGSGLTSADVQEVLDGSEILSVRAGQPIITEGEQGDDIFVIRQGSMIVQKNVGGKPVFLSYLPAGSYVGEMAVIAGGKRTATVRAAVKSEVIQLQGSAFRRLMEKKPALLERARRDMAARQDINAFVESRKDSFSGVVDMYSATAKFLVDNGIGEATDVLLIDENLCVGCDNCEKACADSHDGLSRLDREAGRTYAHLHVPTSCRHCEHPHCMADCPPDAIRRGPDGEVFIDETCIGCGNCQRNCPYGVIRMDSVPPEKPGLLSWLFFGFGPGPGEPSKKWRYKNKTPGVESPKKAIKCDMCSGIDGGPACVRACPTGAAIRVSPEDFLSVARLQREEA